MIKSRGIPGMTGIRGVAALWVMLYHAQQFSGTIFSLPLLEKVPILDKGWHGVDLFFMLSGFILMYAHERDFYLIRKASLIRFARLRFTRVYPLNAVVLLLIAIFVAFQPGFVAWTRASEPSDFSLGAFVRTLFLATRWFLPGRGDWNQPVWSLSLEVLGYLMFPLLAFCALRVARKRQLIGIVSLSLVACFIVAVMQRYFSYDPIGQIAVVRMTACFVTGIAIFRLWTLTSESARKWAGSITSISAVGILLVSLPSRGGPLLNFFFASLLYGLAFQQGIVNSFLSSRSVVFLGTISFPLYLVHLAPLLWLRYFMLTNAAAYSQFQKSAVLICWAIACLLAATILHYFVELPFHALGRRWAGARVPQLKSSG